uniref:chitinase n=1 Tax=Quercus lobata TaxID=97700 RepID=A0A7N2L367_QUELO
MLKHRNDQGCSNGFYTYNAFITAAQSFSAFGTTGDVTTRKRELVAFFGQTSHETTGGWSTAPDGDIALLGKLTGNLEINIMVEDLSNLLSKAIGVDLINNLDLVATDPTISFKTAIWFWMTPQANKPSSHDVIIGNWRPSSSDTSAGRVPGYGVITNIINGGIECGHGYNDNVANRIGFYKRYFDILGVGYGNNLDCNNQRSFA